MIRRKKFAKKPPRPKFLIVCEGKVTERIYLDGIRVDHALQHELFELRFAAGAPRTIIDIAAELKRQNERQYRKEPLSKYTEVWCVFDRDIHDWVPDAFQKAQANKIRIAFSNPNFELFMLLHFEDCNRAYDRHAQAHLLKSFIPDYEKSYDYALLRPGYPEARRRAIVLAGRAQYDGLIPLAPYTSMHNLADSIVALLART
jgi:hypothetical protein